MASAGPVPLWIQGVGICLCGSTLTALGLVLQKYAHGSDHGAQRAKGSRYYLERWWLLGFAVFLSAQLINMVSMAMTPQVVLSCLGSWTLVCNTFFARLLLKEQISQGQAKAIAALVVAMAFVIFNAPTPTPEEEGRIWTIDAVVGRFCSPEFEVLTILALSTAYLARLVALGIAGAALLDRSLWGDADAAQAQTLEVAGVPALGAAACGSELRPACWAAAAAAAAGYTALLFKCLAVLLAGCASAGGFHDLFHEHWEIYAIALGAFCAAPTELHCLNLALQSGEASTVVPTYLSLSMLAQLLTGAVFFQELQDFRSRTQAASFCLGVALTLWAVVSVARTTEQSSALMAGDERAATPQRAAPPPDLQAQLLRCAQGRGKIEPALGDDAAQQVSVAGFAGAIECMDALRGR